MHAHYGAVEMVIQRLCADGTPSSKRKVLFMAYMADIISHQGRGVILAANMAVHTADSEVNQGTWEALGEIVWEARWWHGCPPFPC